MVTFVAIVWYPEDVAEAFCNVKDLWPASLAEIDSSASQSFGAETGKTW